MEKLKALLDVNIRHIKHRVLPYHVTMSFVVAGKVSPTDTIEDFENPRYGRYWWFWTPQFYHNGGSFRRNEVIDMGFNWLCFAPSITFWANHSMGGWCRNMIRYAKQLPRRVSDET